MEETWRSSKDAWRAFLENNRGRTLDDVEAEIKRLNEARIEQLANAASKPAPRRTVKNRRAAPPRNKRMEASAALAR